MDTRKVGAVANFRFRGNHVHDAPRHGTDTADAPTYVEFDEESAARCRLSLASREGIVIGRQSRPEGLSLVNLLRDRGWFPSKFTRELWVPLSQ